MPPDHQTMQAIIQPDTNNPAVELGRLPVPVAGDDQVLIRVAAAGINRPDLLQRQGIYPPPPGAPATLGLEVSGEIVAIGSRVPAQRLGQQVCALLSGGGYAEYAVAAADLCLPIPDNVSLQDAAGLPETFYTVWSNLVDRAHLRSGERLLVHGGSSGIGCAAIQLGRQLGATVFVTAGSEEKCTFCRQLGAQHAINYRQQDFAEVIAARTNGEGVDVILDMVGADYLQRNIRSLREDGRLVQIAVLSGVRAEINLLPFLLKRVTLTGSTLRARPDSFKAEIARALHQHLWPMFAAGGLKPMIHRTFPLQDAARAHDYLESSQHCGKLLLLP